jgi:YVTN family beta-propeller protein
MVLRSRWTAIPVVVLLLSSSLAVAQQSSVDLAARINGAIDRRLLSGDLTPTGERITPAATPGSRFFSLNPDLPGAPNFTAGQAANLALSPDGKTLLVLTSGFNRNFGVDGKPIAALSHEYVFVYDVAAGLPSKQQVLMPDNTFEGLAWAPDGVHFYVSGGVDDDVLEYIRGSASFEAGRVIRLNHSAGLGLHTKAHVAGIAVSPDGTRILAANYQNDSVSLIDTTSGTVLSEADLRPAGVGPNGVLQHGGSFPRAIAWVSNTEAYVGSQRDREIILLGVAESRVSVEGRTKTRGQTAAFVLNRNRDRLYVALDNTDGVAILDTKSHKLVEQIVSVLPTGITPRGKRLGGAGTNSLSLSPDERILYLSDGGLNAISVVRLGESALSPSVETEAKRAGREGPDSSSVIGLIPTGWYPTGVVASRDGRWLYATNGKSVPGSNAGGCRDTLSTAPRGLDPCRSASKYVWQLQKAGLLAMPLPGGTDLARLTRQVAGNDHLDSPTEAARDTATMSFLRRHIHHVIYVVKENRSYDQVLGDLGRGNGDPKLTLLPEPISPNHHALARQFVTLDSFMDSGESSNTGWNWSTAARTNDFTERESPVNYAGRGLQYDQEGTNRDINVGIATHADRVSANPDTPPDPNILSGTQDVAAPDGPDNAEGEGYIWNAALRAGITIRNYGFFGDLTRYFSPSTLIIPLDRDPFKSHRQVFYSTKAALTPVTDIYFRGFDQAFPDYWRFKEWEREFDDFAASGSLPALSLVRLPHDHFGSFDKGIDKVNTVETEMADNDYAVGLLIQKISQSRYAADTLIFVIEDDAQDGADHVDAHRSIALIAGPYVRRSAIVSESYNTVSLLRTMELILGLEPMGLNDALARPMSAVFDRHLTGNWSYRAIVPEVLRSTDLPLPSVAKEDHIASTCPYPQRSSQYWARVMAGQNFDEEDHLDTMRFNAALWQGLKTGPGRGCAHTNGVHESQ